MILKQSKRKSWNLGSLAVASMLALGGCADVDAESSDLDEGSALQQLGDAGSETDAPLSPSGSDAETGPKWAQRSDLGKGDGKDVILIGDSWMSLGAEGLQVALKTINTGYRAYGVPGTKMLSGLSPIPTQFDAAVRADKDIKTIVMTGGGNDVILGGITDCNRRGPNCTKRLAEIKDSLIKLWERAAAAGVQDVVYVGYSESAGSTPAEFTNATKNGVGAACLAVTSLNCHVLDSTPIVGRRLKADGIHPQQAAHRDLAKEVYKLMEERKIRR
jgi:hypothetical protein